MRKSTVTKKDEKKKKYNAPLESRRQGDRTQVEVFFI